MLHDLVQLHDLDTDALRSRPVFVRVDLNVPMRGDELLDDTRIREAAPTVQRLRQMGARLVLASHRGRPKGERRGDLSLEPVAAAAGEVFGCRVEFASDCVGEPAREQIARLEDGDVCLLENLRFHAGEEAGDADFADQLAELTDAYVGDAFGTAHRAHASIAGVPQRLPVRAAGLLMAREAEVLGRLASGPEAPYAALLGGAKISGKIDTLERLVELIDVLLIGGGMANTFLLAQEHDLGGSLVEEEKVSTAREILARCEQRGVTVLLPTDLVVTDDLDAEEPRAELVTANDRFELDPEQLAVDLGPQSRERYSAAVAGAATVFWNGPMGVFEKPPFDAGSRAIAAAVGACEGFSVIGGGETVAAAALADAVPRIDHVSTGGGASLALLAGKPMPGLAALAPRS